MGPPSKKRKLSGPSAPLASDTKRAKRSTPTQPPKSKTKRSIETNREGGKNAVTHDTSKSKGKIVDASALAWETLDQEAFGGLQVIKGVDILNEGGRVQFRVAEGAKNKPKSQNPSETEPVVEVEKGSLEEEEEPFEGFGEDDFDAEDDEDDDDEGNLTPDEDEIFDGDDDVFVNPLQVVKGDLAEESGDEDEQPQSQSQPPKETKAAKKYRDEELDKSASKGNKNAFALLTEDVEMDHVQPGVEDVSAWKPLGLSSPLLDAIAQLGFEAPTKIQAMAVPEILRGHDVIGKAETGSGKTLAFGIPIVESWLNHQNATSGKGDDGEKVPFALVLSPTRELAKQIGDHISRLAQGLRSSPMPYVAVVTGGLSIQKQQRQIARADIIIGTPGRLWEVLDGNMTVQSSFTKIRFLVVDEADRLFKVGQFKEATDIIGALDRRNPEAEDDGDIDESEADGEAGNSRQTLVFSATFDKGLQHKLAGRRKLGGKKEGEEGGDMEYLMKCLKFRTEPKFVDVNPEKKMAAGLKEGLIECGAMEKDLYLYSVLLLNPNRRTLVFTNSISAVRRLTPLLQNLDLNAYPLHSQMIQKARLRSLERFTAPPKPAQPGQPKATASILIATDVAARGLDINDIEQVIHYHVPRSADTYIHRSGRTARGDKQGVSILLCAPDEILPTRRLAAKVHSETGHEAGNKIHMIQSLPIDRKISSRLKPRLDLSKRLADAVLAKEKANSSEQWLRAAAEDLGVDYTSDLSDEAPMGGSGRGGGRKKKEKQAREITKAEMKMLRAKLRDELGKRINMGVSERYVTGGRVDVGKLLKEREEGTVMGIFLGGEGLGLEF